MQTSQRGSEAEIFLEHLTQFSMQGAQLPGAVVALIKNPTLHAEQSVAAGEEVHVRQVSLHLKQVPVLK